MKRYILVEIVFGLLVLLAALKVDTLLALPAYQLAALVALGSFAVFRSARTVSYNKVMEWLRQPFCRVVDDSSGAGQNVEPKEGSVVGELVSCPICSGTWAALILVNLFLYLPRVGWVLFAILGLAGISEVLHWNSERSEWQGRLAREEAGTQWLQKNTKKYVRQAAQWANGYETLSFYTGRDVTDYVREQEESKL